MRAANAFLFRGKKIYAWPDRSWWFGFFSSFTSTLRAANNGAASRTLAIGARDGLGSASWFTFAGLSVYMAVRAVLFSGGGLHIRGLRGPKGFSRAAWRDRRRQEEWRCGALVRGIVNSVLGSSGDKIGLVKTYGRRRLGDAERDKGESEEDSATRG